MWTFPTTVPSFSSLFCNVALEVELSLFEFHEVKPGIYAWHFAEDVIHATDWCAAMEYEFICCALDRGKY